TKFDPKTDNTGMVLPVVAPEGASSVMVGIALEIPLLGPTDPLLSLAGPPVEVKTPPLIELRAPLVWLMLNGVTTPAVGPWLLANRKLPVGSGVKPKGPVDTLNGDPPTGVRAPVLLLRVKAEILFELKLLT